jgi:peptidoglycan/LPS O-acetylase OafA/YrhL
MPDISYGIYLYGWPVQKLLTWYAPSLSVASLCAASVAVSALMGALSWYLIESRFIALPLPPVLRAQPVANARTNSMPTT